VKAPAEIAFARNGEIAIGYAVVGDGPVDLVFVPVVSSLEVLWENPLVEAFLRGLSSFARLVVVDRRGAGVSDRYSPDDLPPLEDLVDDILAVLDAVGSQRPVLFGYSDTGAQCALLAATYPERVRGLVLYAVAARGTQAPDYPWQWSEAEWQEYLDSAVAGWGTQRYAEATLPLFAPSLVGDARQLAWWRRLQRVGSSPGAQLAQERVFRDMDVRRLLPAVGVPTLVLHRADDAVELLGSGRYVADAIPDARFVELEGSDHWPWAGDQQALVSAIGRFVAELRQDEESETNRILATVLFTDIVDSTSQAAALGDRRWRELRERHDLVVRGQLARHRGREIKTVGDGFLATFDGPARAVRCARAICPALHALGIDVRAGLHTGEIELDGDDVSGVAVAIGARVGALAGAGEVLVSSTVKDLVIGSGLAFDDRGEHELKGVPDTWRLFAAVGDARGTTPGG
jgi:pimeloyl-ACP methyl ester carboxylesterase/class 3 adenylate cyclase